MSQDEKDSGGSFLSRWSQRKHEASLPEPEAAAKPVDGDAEALPAQPADSEAEPAFDLSSLPKLEDLTGTTDITQFLRKGVPESLRNAALRKSWALDPAIRNYVNPALDYAFDWNTPGGVPGNSELAAGTDVAKMVLQIMGSPSSTDPAPSSQAADLPHHAAVEESSPDPDIDAAQNDMPATEPVAVRLSSPATTASVVETVPMEPVSVAVQVGSIGIKLDAPQQKMRRHGAAKPRF